MSKIGIVINTNEPEDAWNAVRFGNTSLGEGYSVRIFLLGKGVEIEEIKDEGFNVKGQMDTFLEGGGEIMACGTCLKSRQIESKVCPVSTMKDMLKIVQESDKLLVFG